MQFGVRSNSAAPSVSDFIAAHFTHSGHFCTAATLGSLRNCKVPRPSSWRAMRMASSSLVQSAARYRALHRTTGSSLSGCSRYHEPLQELRSIACATKRPISAVRRHLHRILKGEKPADLPVQIPTDAKPDGTRIDHGG